MGAKNSIENCGCVEVADVKFLWKIEDYSVIAIYTLASSPNIHVSNFSYCLQLYKDTGMEIRLKAVGSSDKQPRIQCKTCVIDEQGQERYCTIKRIRLIKESDGEVLMKIPRSRLDKEKSAIFPNNTLTIRLNVTLLDDTEDEEFSQTNSTQFLETLSNDFGRHHQNKTYTDFILKCGNKQFPVHQTVLSARSEVFAAMFRHDTSEKRKGETRISDITPDTMSDVLYYIYTGKLRALSSSAFGSLYVAADKYQLLELRSACLERIQTNLSVQNICAAAILADTYNEEILKNAVVRYVEENLNDVLETDQWKAFLTAKPLLANTILTEAFVASKQK